MSACRGRPLSPFADQAVWDAATVTNRHSSNSRSRYWTFVGIAASG